MAERESIDAVSSAELQLQEELKGLEEEKESEASSLRARRSISQRLSSDQRRSHSSHEERKAGRRSSRRSSSADAARRAMEQSFERGECCICYEPLHPEITAGFDRCMHELCITCIGKSIYRKPSCPLCRAKVKRVIPKLENPMHRTEDGTWITGTADLPKTKCSKC